MSDHMRAVLQAVLVVMLWASSWVLIKIGLGAIPAITFAGLRYVLAFVILALLAVRPARIATLRTLTPTVWVRLLMLGLLYYAVTQGASFVALSLLPAITTNLLWSFSTVAVAVLGFLFLNESPQWLQWIGMVFYLVGVMVYFTPLEGTGLSIGGVVVALGGVLANAVASVLGRHVNRSGDLDPLSVTLVSMGFGSIILLITGMITQGLPSLPLREWLIVLWLAVVNTAFAFTLWNHTQRTLSALESSIINSLMLVFIPLLAWAFLGEQVTMRQGLGMIAAGAGILIVQLRPDRISIGRWINGTR